MIYAQVIVSSRTNVQELTYNVPASIIPYIKRGSTVTVPLRHKSVRGVVIKLSKKVPGNIKSKLRDIITIEKSGIGFSEKQIETIEDLADCYGSSFSEVAYHALKWPGKIFESIINKSNKPTFIQAPWVERKKFYTDLIDKYSKTRSLLFIFASKSYLEDFITELNKLEVLNTTLVKDEKKLRQKIYNGEGFSALGLQGLAFIPLKANDLFIVDLPDSISMYQQRRPFMSVKEIGKVRAKNESISLILGANILPLSDYLYEEAGAWRVIRKKLKDLPIVITDKRASRDIIMPTIIDQIADTKSILFLAASKAWAPALCCKKCGELMTCDNCGQTLVAKTGNQLSCNHCGNSQQYPTSCQSCGGREFKLLGMGTARLSERISQVMNVSVSTISSLTTELPTNQVVVATEKIINFPQRRYQAAVVVDVDWQLTDASINSSWHMLDILMFIRSISSALYVQTYLPDHWVWGALRTESINRETYTTQLRDRKKYHLPPYGESLLLVNRSVSLSKLKDEYESIYQSLSKYMPSIDISSPTSRNSSNTFTTIVYASSSKLLSSQEKQLLRKLVPLSWAINYNK